MKLGVGVCIDAVKKHIPALRKTRHSFAWLTYFVKRPLLATVNLLYACFVFVLIQRFRLSPRFWIGLRETSRNTYEWVNYCIHIYDSFFRLVSYAVESLDCCIQSVRHILWQSMIYKVYIFVRFTKITYWESCFISIVSCMILSLLFINFVSGLLNMSTDERPCFFCANTSIREIMRHN